MSNIHLQVPHIAVYFGCPVHKRDSRRTSTQWTICSSKPQAAREWSFGLQRLMLLCTLLPVHLTVAGCLTLAGSGCLFYSGWLSLYLALTLAGCLSYCVPHSGWHSLWLAVSVADSHSGCISLLLSLAVTLLLDNSMGPRSSGIAERKMH